MTCRGFKNPWFLNFMVEQEKGFDYYPHPHIRGARSQRHAHTNGIFSPDTPVEKIRDYLLDQKIYGLPKRPRTFRGPGFRLPPPIDTE